MNPFLHPRWIFFSTILPQLTLFIIYYNAFQVFGMELEQNIVSNWYVYGFSFLGIIIAQTIYAGYSTYHSKPVHAIWSFTTVIIYLFLLLSYYLQASDLVPRSVPDWIRSVTDVQSFMGMFIFPAMLHAIIVAVIFFTEREEQQENGKESKYHFWVMLLIPLSIYLTIALVIPLLNNFLSYKFASFAAQILVSIIVILALFWLLRVVYLFFQKNANPHSTLIFEVLFTSIFPLTGLAFSYSLDNPFGNFQSPWLFGLAIFTGILLVIPSENLQSYKARFVHFLLKAFVFPYTVYFFIVFMPFTPLSVILVIAAGTGILMLTPLVLFLIHSRQLYQDYDYLSKNYSSSSLFISFLVAAMIVPLAFSLNTYYDRIQLHKGLDYLYSSDYDETKSVPNPNSISATLTHIENFKVRRNRDFWSKNDGIPLLDSYYKWLVLDNMTLSESKINLLNNVFVGEDMPKPTDTWRWWNGDINQNRDFQTGKGDKTVKIDSTTITSVFDSIQNAWISKVDLVLHSQDTTQWGQQEYATFFDLPEGAFISNYYLYVGEEKVEALLAEKKTALWVYRQIVNTRKDPGIIYYNDKGRLGFRVFPFVRDEYRKTGFEVLHAEPFELKIDDSTTVFLGEKNAIDSSETLITSNSNYVSQSELKDLKIITRKPYYHFILDNSKYGGVGKEKYIERVENFLKENPLQSDLEAKYTVVDFELNELGDNWKKEYLESTNKGGFFLEKAVKKIWLENYLQNLNLENSDKATYPIIVVVSDELEDGVWTGSLHEWKKYVPEGFEFYELASNNRIMLQNFEHFKMLGEPLDKNDKIKIKEVKQIANNGKNYFLPVSINNGITLPITDFEKKEEITSADIEEFEKLPKYSQALLLQNLNETMALYPNQAEKRWLEQVQKSFTARILTPVTTFMVLETEAQRNALLKKQDEVLSGKRLLDLTDARRSSEPSLWIFMAIFGVLFLVKYRNFKI